MSGSGTGGMRGKRENELSVLKPGNSVLGSVEPIDVVDELETTDAWAGAERRLDRELEDFLDDLAAGQGIVRRKTDILVEYDHIDGEGMPS
jgi:hypothetical protein